MAQKKITELQLISAVIDALNFPGDDGIQSYRATAAQLATYMSSKLLVTNAIATAMLQAEAVTRAKIATAALPAPTLQKFLSTGTQTGWLFTVTSCNATVGATYTNNSNTYTVLGTVSGSTLLWCTGTGATSGSTLTKATGTGDATITFSAKVAFATYTTPASVLYLKIKMVGGGGGGGPGGSLSTDGTSGGGSYLGINLLSANGGAGGGQNGGTVAGGTASLGSASGIAVSGGAGGAPGTSANGTNGGGMGGSSIFGGSGGGAYSNAPGSAGATNSGAGGGGGGGSNSSVGAGGGAGGGVEALIISPAATYPYVVGAAGAAGTGSNAGGAGAAGVIIVEEFYQ